jgi:hypothetical protein
MIYSIFGFLALMALPAFVGDATDNIDLRGIEIPGSAEIISVIANINTSDHQSAQSLTGWTYILRDETGNCTGYFEPIPGQNSTIGAIPMDCPKGLMAIDKDEINFTRALEVVMRSESNEATAYDKIFLIKPLNSTEPVWEFVAQDGKKILVGAISEEVLGSSQGIKAAPEAKSRLRLGSSEGASDRGPDWIDIIVPDELQYAICVDACIAGCHSLPSDIYSPGYTLDDCISECPGDCK